MAGTSVQQLQEFADSSMVERLRSQLNNAIDDLEVLRAALNTLATNFNATLTKLDADAGVTDANYSSLQAVVRTAYDTASDLVAAKTTTHSG